MEKITAALYQTVAQNNGDEDITIAHRFHRRNWFGRLLITDIGCYAGDVPIRLARSICNDVDAASRALRIHRAGMIFSGVEYELLANSGILPSVSDLAKIRLNYQPFQRSLSTDSFRIEGINTFLFEPDQHVRRYDLDCIVRKDLAKKHSLVFIVRYNRLHYSKSDIESFVLSWVKQIRCWPN